MYQTAREPCGLCGLTFGSNEQELIDHVEKHADDFLKRRYRCEECLIDLASQANLHLHLESAKEEHCGFSFFHEAKDGMQCTPQLPGLEIERHKRR